MIRCVLEIASVVTNSENLSIAARKGDAGQHCRCPCKAAPAAKRLRQREHVRWPRMRECTAVFAGAFLCTRTAAAAGPRRKPMAARLAPPGGGHRRLSRSPKKPMRGPLTAHGNARGGPLRLRFS
eukprot:scaffold479_cov376-Prasinococcus_capsulatus_cf.AAC.15